MNQNAEMNFVKLFLKYNFPGNTSIYVFITQIYIYVTKKIIDKQLTDFG